MHNILVCDIAYAMGFLSMLSKSGDEKAPILTKFTQLSDYAANYPEVFKNVGLSFRLYYSAEDRNCPDVGYYTLYVDAKTVPPTKEFMLIRIRDTLGLMASANILAAAIESYYKKIVREGEEE